MFNNFQQEKAFKKIGELLKDQFICTGEQSQEYLNYTYGPNTFGVPNWSEVFIL